LTSKIQQNIDRHFIRTEKKTHRTAMKTTLQKLIWYLHEGSQFDHIW